jgi:hypothetical protein
MAKLQTQAIEKPTYLKPDLLVKRGNLLSGSERRDTLLALNWDCWHVTIGLRVRCEMRRGMMRSHTRCGGWLSVRHDFSILIELEPCRGQTLVKTCDTMMQSKSTPLVDAHDAL